MCNSQRPNWQLGEPLTKPPNYITNPTQYNRHPMEIGLKGKVFYGQEHPSGEPTTSECGVKYKLLTVIYWSSPMGDT